MRDTLSRVIASHRVARMAPDDKLAKQPIARQTERWMASSLTLLAMTAKRCDQAFAVFATPQAAIAAISSEISTL
jgi:hypothetical protein